MADTSFVDYYTEAQTNNGFSQTQVDAAASNATSHPASSNIGAQLENAINVVNGVANAGVFLSSVSTLVREFSQSVKENANALTNIQTFFTGVYATAEQTYTESKSTLDELKTMTETLKNLCDNPIDREDFKYYEKNEATGEMEKKYHDDRYKAAKTKWEEDITNLKIDCQSYSDRFAEYCSYLDSVNGVNPAVEGAGAKIPKPSFAKIDKSYNPKPLESYMTLPEDHSNDHIGDYLEGDELAAFKRAHNIPENEDVDVYVVNQQVDGKDVPGYVIIPASERGNISEAELDAYIQENFKPENANNLGVVNTNSSNLNFRSTPGGSIQGSLPKGTEIEILEADNGSGWTKVRLSDGREGYVYTKYLYDTGEPRPAVYSFSSNESDGATKVDLKNGNSGYISIGEPQREFNPSATVATRSSNLNLRATAGGQVLGSIPKGTELEVIESDTEGTGWTKVRLSDGRVGYVSTKYIEQQQVTDNRTPTQVNRDDAQAIAAQQAEQESADADAALALTNERVAQEREEAIAARMDAYGESYEEASRKVSANWSEENGYNEQKEYYQSVSRDSGREAAVEQTSSRTTIPSSRTTTPSVTPRTTIPTPSNEELDGGVSVPQTSTPLDEKPVIEEAIDEQEKALEEQVPERALEPTQEVAEEPVHDTVPETVAKPLEGAASTDKIPVEQPKKSSWPEGVTQEEVDFARKLSIGEKFTNMTDLEVAELIGQSKAQAKQNGYPTLTGINNSPTMTTVSGNNQAFHRMPTIDSSKYVYTGSTAHATVKSFKNLYGKTIYQIGNKDLVYDKGTYYYYDPMTTKSYTVDIDTGTLFEYKRDK